MALLLAAVLFGVYVINVVLGAYGHAAFLGDVGEMLLLSTAVVAFVVAALKSEAVRDADRPGEPDNQREETR